MGLVPRRLSPGPTAAARSRRPGALAVLGRSLAVGLGVCGAGLLAGLPSPFVPDPVEPAAGVLLLLLAARLALRTLRTLRRS